MSETLTKFQTLLLRTWVYGVILGFLGAASLNGPFTPERLAYKVARFLLVSWVLFEFDRRGNMDRSLVRNLLKFSGIAYLLIATLVLIYEVRISRGILHFLNGFLLSAVLAIPTGTAMGLFFTNLATNKRSATEPTITNSPSI